MHQPQCRWIFFNKVNIFPPLEEFPLKIILFLPRVKNSEQQESDVK